MPRSTHDNRHQALVAAVNFAGPLRHTDGEQAQSYAFDVFDCLTRGGWHLVHADDLPAGYAPGDVIRHLGNLYDHAADPLPEPTAVLGETPDEMRRRLPMTDPVSHAVARQLGWQEDPTPTTETPQEPTHEAEIPFGRELDADQQRISEIERTVHGQRLRAEGLEERADDHDARIDALEITTRNTTELQREIQDLRTTVHHHLESAYPHRSERHDTEAPHDEDARLGGHDNPHDDDDQAHNQQPNETR